jgi:hypothetical protein
MRPTLHAPHSPLTNDASALGPEHPLVIASARERLARSLDVLCEAARPAEQCDSIQPNYAPRVARILSAELSEAALRQQLHQIRFLVAS